MNREIIFNKSVPGRKSSFLNECGVSFEDIKQFIPARFLRERLEFPSLGELDVVRHYINLSKLNFSVDANFYPLGSCTMKYNPKLNEDLAGIKEFGSIHPYQDQDLVQGALKLVYDLGKVLCAVTGMSRFSFQAAAGAQAELAGLLIIRAYHNLNKNSRSKVIIPDSAHGTNPATASMCGYDVVVVKSTPEGLVDVDELSKVVDDDTAAIMLTNPNTLGLFEERILDISDILHKKKAFLYYDGANFNPLMGVVDPFSMGFDVIHLNLHKTFSTPHGSGGPGVGALGVIDKLKEFLPVPVVDKKNDVYFFNYELRNTIGRVKAFYGNFLVLVKAYAYILRLGRQGLKRVAENSVLNARYIKEKLKNHYKAVSLKACMHEVVFSCEHQRDNGVSVLEIAKRLIDFGIHPPTIYFPLIVKEALMVEPTETESKETLDHFISAMKEINSEIQFSPQKFKYAPFTTPVRRVDETAAARSPDLRWKKTGG